MEKYKGIKRHEVPPHVFAITDTAYRSMLQGNNKKVLKSFSTRLRDMSTIVSVNEIIVLNLLLLPLLSLQKRKEYNVCE